MSITQEQIEDIKEHVAETIRETVNGKIDDISDKLDAHIVRVEPVIQKYEETQAAKKTLSEWSGIIIKISQVLLAFGVIATIVTLMSNK